MKNYLTYGMFLLSVLFMNVKLSSQDVQFSQFYMAKFNIAPSFAGSAEDGRLTLLTRDQWPMLKNAFVTFAFGLDYSISSLHGGAGIYAMQDYSNGGGYITTNTGFQYSYEVKLNKIWQFRPGLQFTMVNERIDVNKITFGNQLSFDGKNSNIPVNIESNNINNYEAAASVLFFSDISWIGMNVDHIPFTKNTFSSGNDIASVKFMTFGGFLLKKIQGRLLYNETFIYFSYLFKYQNQFKQMDLGVYWAKKNWELGLWYRGLPFIKNSYNKFNNSALIFKAGMEFKNCIVGYSYDCSLSTSGITTGGAHEFSLVYLFDLTDDLKSKKHKMVPSPRF